MDFKLHNFSLHHQLVAIFIGFVILVVVSFAVTAHFQHALLETTKKIDTAKELQLLPMQLSSECKLYLKGEAGAKKIIDNISSSYDAALNQFIKDKDAQDVASDSILVKLPLATAINRKWVETKSHIDDILLEPATIDTVVQESKQVALNDTLNTTETTQKVLTISNPKIERAANAVQKSSKDLYRLGKQLRDEQLLVYQETDNKLTYASLSLLGFFIIAVIVLLVLIYRKVLNPLKELEQVASHVSKGDVSVSSAYNKNDEIGKIARSVNAIKDNLRNATAFINAIEKGKLDEDFKGLNEESVTENSLEGALLTMRDEMKKVAQEEQKRKWSTEGLAQFVDILRSTENNVQTLGDVIISNLVDYTKSNQGGIYVLNEEDEENTFLELVSLYAFNTKKYDKKSYRLGEGLIGQAFLERDTIYLLEIPQEYISITSGLGGANPKAILLVPLKINDVIYGVVELASFNEYKDYEIEFVEKLAESIASTIAGVRNNQRTKRLLEESQALTEQMQAQEEEMRQNMEELSATQEEMARKEVEMTAQLTAINNSLASAEFNMEGVLIKANENYVDTFGFGHPDDSAKISFAALHDGDTKRMWQKLTDGTRLSGEYTKITRSGKKLLVNTTYTPVKNSDGKYFKIIELVLNTGTSESTADAQLIDNMKEVEEALRQNMEELEVTQEQLDRKLQLSEANLRALDGVLKIIVSNTAGTIISINQPVESLTGLDMSQVQGKKITDIIGEDILTEGKGGQKQNLTIKSNLGFIETTAEIRHDVERGLIYVIWM